jgi:hypothetical protein
MLKIELVMSSEDLLGLPGLGREPRIFYGFALIFDRLATELQTSDVSSNIFYHFLSRG